MTHDEVVLSLPGLVRGDLAEGERGGVTEHLAVCEECAETLKILRLLRDQPAEHPTSSEIVDFVMRHDAIEPMRTDEISTHLASCDSCREEVAAAGRAYRATPTSGGQWAFLTSVSAWPSSARWALASAAALAAVLVFPAFIGMRELPGTKAQIARLQESASLLGVELDSARRSLMEAQAAVARVERGVGIIVGPFLTAANRGESQVPTLKVGPGDLVVDFRVEFSLPADVPAGSVVLFEVLSSDRQPPWEAEMSVAETAATLREAGSIVRLVPCATLGEGRHELRVSLRRGAETRLISSIPFDISRGS